MKRFVLMIVAVMLCSVAVAQMPTTYRNPVIKGDIPDPSMVCFKGVYYATGTSSEWAPHYPLYKSTDMVNWEPCGHIFEKKPEWTKSSFWAPELYVYNDKVYVYYTARKLSDNISCIGVAVADDPEKGFVDYGPVVEFGNEAIDAFVLEDEGKLYISWKAYGLAPRPVELVACQLSDDGLQMEGEVFSVMVDTGEGQQWMKVGDYYYMIESTKGCCGPGSDYQVEISRSKNLRGPYERYEGNPILKGEGPVQSIGHGTIAKTPDGRMYYLCHAYLSGVGFYGGRQPFLQEIALGEDGWLHFVEGDKAKIEHPLPPTVKGFKWKSGDFTDEFSGKKLRPEWSWNFINFDVKTSLKGGKLSLSGKSTDGSKQGAVLALRPTNPDYFFKAEVANRNDSWKGIVFYGDGDNLMTLGCKGDKIILKSIKDGKEEVLASADMPKGKVVLSMTIQEGTRASFEWQDKNGMHPIGEQGIELKSFVRWDRVARPGLYHEGDMDAPAIFESAQMGDFFWIR